MNARQRLHTVLSYLSFRSKRTHIQVLHSPFVYRLYSEVIAADAPEAALRPVEAQRQQMLHNHNKLSYPDLGAGTVRSQTIRRSVSRLARHSLKPPAQVRLLFRLVQFFKPRYVIELGTCLGISASAMAMAMRGNNLPGKLITIEGAEPVAALAAENINALQLQNDIEQRIGNFDTELLPCLQQTPQLDFAFIDGNHRYASTLRYFELCLQKVHNDSVLVLDDIYWSEEMTKAWEQIKQHPRVTVTVDLFHLGLVFFRKEQAKEHFRLKF